MQHAEVSFRQWIGKSVVLQIVIDDLRVPVWGTIFSETSEAVRIEVDDWLIYIEKSVIRAVVEVEGQEFGHFGRSDRRIIGN